MRFEIQVKAKAEKKNKANQPRYRASKASICVIQPQDEDVERFASRQALDDLGGSPDRPVILMDLSKAEAQLQLWKESLPRVRPHYAVKCNPDRLLLQTLQKGGCGFDCATMDEIDRALSIGVPPGDIVLSHPCKLRSHIAFAKSQGVSLMSFDNSIELQKVAAEFPGARLLLRLVCDDAGAQCPMSMKFGASREIWASLLDLASELELTIAGVSFHVGSGCKDPRSFKMALAHAREVFELAKERGQKPDVLDIGGGFPSGHKTGAAIFVGIAQIVSEQLDLHFPASDFPNLSIIAEPGRFFASSIGTLLTKVYSKAVIPATAEDSQSGRPTFRYYVNDGLYGSFNCILYDHAVVVPEPLHEPKKQDELFQCCMFGPTCDGLDMILNDHQMPELQEGDWILWRNMGAYTSAAGSKFNGFPPAVPWYYSTTAIDAA